MGRRRRGSDAGKAALDYYAAALAAWRRRMRLPLLISLLVACGLALPTWVYFPHGAFFAGLLVGGTYGMAFWIWTEPPEFIAKWKRGGEGERKTGTVLKRLERDGWESVHGREARYGDLDHIAVGPAGVFLLNSKNLSGHITLQEEGLTSTQWDSPRDSFTQTKLSLAMRAEAARLKERIQSATQLKRWVQAVVVVWGDFDGGESEHQGVLYIGGDRLEGWLRRQPHRLSRRDTELIQLGLKAEIIVPRAPPLMPSSATE